MTLSDLLRILKSQDAFIVHCARSNRGGEMKSNPIYPNDLRDTKRDLDIGSGRSVSCSVVWPAHQDTFGEIGIIVRPRVVGEIVRLSTGDAGTLEGGDGGGEPLSHASVGRTFTNSTSHNEWVLTGGEVVGIFLNFDMGLYVARMLDIPPGISVEDAKALGVTPALYPVKIAVPEIAGDFPDLPLFGFVDGLLMEIDATGNPVAPGHPY
jgi:hypothetical protein